MKIKVKLSIMMIAIVAIVAGGLAIIQLVKSNGITLALSNNRILLEAIPSITKTVPADINEQ